MIVDVRFQIEVPWCGEGCVRESHQRLYFTNDSVDLTEIARSLRRGLVAVGYIVSPVVKFHVWGK